MLDHAGGMNEEDIRILDSLYKIVDSPNRRKARHIRHLFIYYKNESRLPSNDIAIIASCIDERAPKENRILYLWDYFLTDSDLESSSIPLCDCR